MSAELEALVVRKTHRMPVPDGKPGDGAAAARQFDAAAMAAGWKLSGPLLARLSALDAGTVIDTAVRVLDVARRETGDHVRHNAYFRDFPANVPDTLEFWAACLRDAILVGAEIEAGTVVALGPDGVETFSILNLLSLPSYGSYQHSYEEMVAAHDDLIPLAGDRLTVLHLGGTLDEEISALYLSLASATVPGNEADLAALADLALACASGPQPEKIPVRENRAIINRVRLDARRPLLADTVTDVLRLACAASGGDVTLEKATRFRSFARPERRLMLAALGEVISGSEAKLGDVPPHAEQWKRLGERLHPHEHPQYPGARAVFEVARGERKALSFAGQAQAACACGNAGRAVSLLSAAPGRLFRSLDHLLRIADGQEDAVLRAAEAAAGQVSGRVVLSVREHFQNRQVRTDASRVFANRKGTAWVAADERDALDPGVIETLLGILDAEVARRLPTCDRLLVDPAMLGVALPLSGKSAPSGLGVMPRGSVCPVDGNLLRFFTYWKERQNRTDYDLSALLLDGSYKETGQLSWTNLTAFAGQHSGDITSAANGASEFINLDLRKVPGGFIVPQVNIYSGEGFEEAEESFFGFMTREAEQKGLPFEPRTVRMKSDLRGKGNVALPLAFMRGDDGKWRAKWMHLYLKGSPRFNRVEGNKVTASLLARGIIERDYIRVRYITDLLLAAGAKKVTVPADGSLPDFPVTCIGTQKPDGLAEGSQVYALANLADLIPA